MSPMFKFTAVLMASCILAACASAPQTQKDVYYKVLDQDLKQTREASKKETPSKETPYKIAAGDDALALRATPSSAVVTQTYEFVHTSDYADIEARLRDDIPGTTRRLYSAKHGVRVKYISERDVYYWSAASGQMRKGTWEIKEGKFGPQICEIFYGEETCLNTVEQLSGVGMIDSLKGDVFGLANGRRPVVGEDGLPGWG